MFRDSQVTSDELILQVFIDDVSDYLSDDLYDPSVVSISESSLRFAVNISSYNCVTPEHSLPLIFHYVWSSPSSRPRSLSKTGSARLGSACWPKIVARLGSLATLRTLQVRVCSVCSKAAEPNKQRSYEVQFETNTNRTMLCSVRVCSECSEKYNKQIEIWSS